MKKVLSFIFNPADASHEPRDGLIWVAESIWLFICMPVCLVAAMVFFYFLLRLVGP